MPTWLSTSLLDLCEIETKLASDGTPICTEVAAALAAAKAAVADAKATTEIAIAAEKETESVYTAAGISLTAARGGAFNADTTPTVIACKKVCDASFAAYKKSIAAHAIADTTLTAYKKAVALATSIATSAALVAKEQADRKLREVGFRNASRLRHIVEQAEKNYDEAVVRARTADADLAASATAEVEAAKAAFDILNAAYKKANAAANLKM